MGAPKSTPLACVQRTAASSPAAAVATAIEDASGTVRCTAPSPKPRYAGVVATVQTPAKIAGTAIDASLMRASEKGRQRARPGTRKHPEPAKQRDHCAEQGESGHHRGEVLMPASRGVRWRIVPAEIAGCGNRHSRCHSRQMIASSPNPLPRLGCTWPRSMARRSTTMSRASPMSSAKKAPEMPLTRAPPLSSLARRICLQPKGGQYPARRKHQSRSRNHDHAELDAEIVRQAQAEPPCRHTHHAEQGTDAQQPEDVGRHRVNVPVDTLLCGSEGDRCGSR